MNKNNKDAQFEAMASYFKSMLNPVSTKTIKENLSEKLNSASEAIEETSVVASAEMKAVVKTDENPVEAPEIKDEVTKSLEVTNVAEVKAEETKSSEVTNVAEIKAEETKSSEVTNVVEVKDEETKSSEETKAVEVKEEETKSSEETNVAEVKEEETKSSDITNVAEVKEEETKSSVITDNPENKAFRMQSEGFVDSQIVKKDDYNSSKQDTEAKEESNTFAPLSAGNNSDIGAVYSGGLRRERSDFKPVPQQETKVEASSPKPLYEPNADTLNKLSRIISQVKPEVKTETEIVTITGPRRSAVALAETKAKVEVKQVTTTTEAPVVAPVKDIQKQAAPVAVWENIKTDDEFQALFFKVDKVTFAVPLVDLGSIENLTKVTPIFGKPDWFMGMMNVREEKVSTVDFAKWAMPQIAVNPDDFHYLIELGTSLWGITCTELIGTENLRKDQVQWRTSEGKRPWLAGIVKNKMCALIHVTELVKLFKKGVNIEGN